MLPTFVIGLREGLEAALIVGIVAAFLKQRGRRDLLRLVWLGVGVAALLCLGVGVGLHVLSADLPQKQQEGLETIVGAIAVVMVTYMVVWMRRHSRDLKKQLEGAADTALESGSGFALVAMAFLAVFREGFETAVFLLAAFNNSANPAQAGVGALLGLLVALVLGYGIYRGGVRINLSKFFRFTGLVLVFVAAGLVVSALHTAHEAGWLNSGQSRTVDLTWLVQPGSVQSSLLTGMLGLQPRPVVIELIGWLIYLIPIGLYVAWPPGRTAPHRAVIRFGVPLAVVALVTAIGLTIATPSSASIPKSTTVATDSAASLTVTVSGKSGATRDVTLTDVGGTTTWKPTESGADTINGRPATIYTQTGHSAADPSGLAATMTLDQIRKLNGGRLPLGVRADTEPAAVPVTYATTSALTLALDRDSGRVLSVRLDTTSIATAALSVGATSLGTAAETSTVRSSDSSVAGAAQAGAQDDRTADRRSLFQGYALAAWLVALIAGVGSAASIFALRRRPDSGDGSATSVASKRTEAVHS